MWFCNPIFQNLCYLMHLGQLKPFNNFSIFLSQGWKYHSDDILYYNWIFTCLWSISMFIDIEIVQIRFKQFIHWELKSYLFLVKPSFWTSWRVPKSFIIKTINTSYRGRLLDGNIAGWKHLKWIQYFNL